MPLQTMEISYIAHELIDQYLDTLIGRVRADVEATKIYEDKDIMGKSQFSNLTSVARETESLQVIITWIQYQIGRTKEDKTWRRANFGEQVIKSLQELELVAVDLTNKPTNLESTERKAMMAVVRIGLARQYIGQMERYITYKRTQ